jgi:regulatory protein
MLRLKLEARGFSGKAAKVALERLKAKGFLDDRRFAMAYAASRLGRRSSKPEGPSSIAAALRERGIDRSTAAEALAELLDPAKRADALEAAAAKALKRADGDKKEARRRLRELGFNSEEISELFSGE